MNTRCDSFLFPFLFFVCVCCTTFDINWQHWTHTSLASGRINCPVVSFCSRFRLFSFINSLATFRLLTARNRISVVCIKSRLQLWHLAYFCISFRARPKGNYIFACFRLLIGFLPRCAFVWNNTCLQLSAVWNMTESWALSPEPCQITAATPSCLIQVLAGVPTRAHKTSCSATAVVDMEARKFMSACSTFP